MMGNLVGAVRPYPPTAQAYVNLKFGMFIHFNMQTFIADAGWELGNATEDEDSFDPGSTLDVEQWISTAILAKMQYAVLTAKHADGFCLWPSASTTHDIASSSWYASNGNLDIVNEFVTECTGHGIRPVLYFSIGDGNFEATNPGYTKADYKNFLQAQMTELLSNYGTIHGIWLDSGYWKFSNTYYPWDSYAEMAAFIKGLQPNCLILNNSHVGSLADTDIVVYEGAGWGDTPPTGNTDPAEFADTIRIDNKWFWHSAATTLVPATTILSTLNDLASLNFSYLLDCPPDNTGVIPADTVAVLARIGAEL